MTEVSNTPPVQETERDKYNFDVGFESGWGERNAQLLDKIETAIESLIRNMRNLLTELSAD